MLRRRTDSPSHGGQSETQVSMRSSQQEIVLLQPGDDGDVNIYGGTVYSANNITFTSNHHHTVVLAPRLSDDDQTLAILRAHCEVEISFWKTHAAIVAKRTDHTGKIFVMGRDFQVWLKLPGGILWAIGGPGVGKTFLASTIFETVEESVDLTDDSDQACTIAYLRYHHHWTTWDIILALIIHLVECASLPAVLKAVNKALGGRRKRRKPSLSDLVTLLQTIVKHFGRCYIIIDGLDEMKPEYQFELIKAIAELEANLLLTSRELKLVQDQLTRLAPRKPVFVTIAAQPEDLELFIRDTIDRTPTLARLLGDAYPMERLVARISKQAHGMFLHAALQMELLKNCIDLSELLELLDRFPAGMDALYTDTVDRIGRQPSSHASRAKTALAWLVHSKGPLSIDDLRYAVGSFPPDYHYDPSRAISEDNLLLICCGLVSLDEESRQASLIHATAQDALTSILLNHCPRPQAMMMKACISCLVKCGFQSVITAHGAQAKVKDVYTQHPLLQHAHRNVHHYIEAAIREEPELRPLVWQFIRECHSYPLYERRIQDEDTFGFFDLLSPLHVACLFNQVALVQELVADDMVDINARTLCEAWEGLTSLDIASSESHEDVVAFLLTLPNIDLTQGDFTPLMWAAHEGRTGVVKLLLDHFRRSSEPLASPTAALLQQVHQRDSDGRFPLIDAAQQGHVGVVELLLSVEGIDVNQTDKEGLSPLIMATLRNHPHIVKQLVATPGVDVNHTTDMGLSALPAACRTGRSQIVEALLNAPDIDVNRTVPDPDLGNPSSLIVACSYGHRDVLKLLLAHHGLSVNQTNDEERTPLMVAVERGYIEMVESLLQVSGIDVNQTDAGGLSALLIACESGYADIVKLLLAHSGDPSQCDNEGWSPLIIAAANGCADVVEVLVDIPGIDLNYTLPESGSSALTMAAQNGYADVVKRLVECPDLDINHVRSEGASAIFQASEEGHTEVVKLLLEHSELNVNCVVDGWTPLMVASEKGNTEVVELLLAALGIDVNYIEPEGKTSALLIASRNGQGKVVEMLMNTPGVDANQANIYGLSALMIASQHGHVSVVQVLLGDPRVDVNQKDLKGRSALDIASEQGHDAVLLLLRDAHHP